MTEPPEDPTKPGAERARVDGRFLAAALIAAIVLLIAIASFYR